MSEAMLGFPDAMEGLSAFRGTIENSYHLTCEVQSDAKKVKKGLEKDRADG